MLDRIFVHRAETRQHKDFGFMSAYLSFKPHFSSDRQRFGSLITIDDGTLTPGAQGFGFHPHRDVEVVTFLVDGEVNHLDPNKAGHNGTLRSKGIQIITAGTGIVHNEVNHSATEPMRALQIWFEPRKSGLAPAYSKRHLEPSGYTNRLQLVLSPGGKDESLVVQQDVCLRYGLFDRRTELRFERRAPGNGVYVFVIDGEAHMAGEKLAKGDALGSVGAAALPITVEAGAELLVFDLAMSQF